MMIETRFFKRLLLLSLRRINHVSFSSSSSIIIVFISLLFLWKEQRCFHYCEAAFYNTNHSNTFTTTSTYSHSIKLHTNRVSTSYAAVQENIEQLGDPVALKYTEYYDDSPRSQGEKEEEHEPVILLHGLLGQKRNFASLGSSLSSQLKKKRKIYTIDLRNHGDNHHDWRDEMSYTHMCHDVLAFMDQLKLEKAILIGHSMGGKVAKSCALQYPDRISGLVVLDIAPVKYTTKDPAWNAVKGIIDSLKDVRIEAGMTKRNVDQALRSSVEDPALRAFVLTNLEEDKEKQSLRWKINIDSIASQLDVIAGFDYGTNDGNDMKKYHGDTFFINGGTSSFVKTAHMETISRHFPNYMLTTIRGSGHWVHAEAPDDTLLLLKKYLDR